MTIAEETEVEAALTADEWLQLNKLAHRAADGHSWREWGTAGMCGLR